MNVQKIKNVTYLFQLARDWFLSSPQEPIPLATWHNYLPGPIDEHHEDFGAIWTLYHEKFWVGNVSTRIIPALAAISLGASTQTISKILSHHMVSAQDLARCKFGLNCAHDKAVNSNSLSSWSVTHAIVQGLCHDPIMAKQFVESINYISNNHDREMACLLTNVEDLWPITHIRKYIDDVESGAREISDLHPEMTEYLVFESTTADLRDFSNQQILLMLERAGVFCHDAHSEHGFRNDFFRHCAIPSETPSTQNTRIFEALNSADDPVLIEKIGKRIIASLAQENIGVRSLDHLNEVLDRSKYAFVISSMVLKLNLLRITRMEGLKTTSPNILDTPCFQEFALEPHKILERLHDELGKVEPESFSIFHFKALHYAFSGDPTPQEISRHDAKELLSVALLGFDAYSASQDMPSKSSGPRFNSDLAGELLMPLIKFSAKHSEHDYQWLTELTSTAKYLLAKGGFDIRRLPGISNKHRGLLLSDHLGL
jgi:hypothetical protein